MGLFDTNFTMKSLTGGTIVDLPLCRQSVPELARPVDDNTDEMTYLTMKHHISMACYQGLAAYFPELSKKHKVQTFLLYSSIN